MFPPLVPFHAPKGMSQSIRTGRYKALFAEPRLSAEYQGTPGGDRLAGSADADFLFGHGGNDVLVGMDGDDLLRGGGGNDVLRGANGHDTLNGGIGNDRLVGGRGLDLLVGGAGDDVLVGGGESDYLFGGSGADTFVIDAPDLHYLDAWGNFIGDFSQAEGDSIDLSALGPLIDGGDGAFAFIGDGAFSGTAGEVRYEIVETVTVVLIDVDGDGSSDLSYEVMGPIEFTASDFNF